jgi:spore coat protein A, manganese oxidase
MATTRISRREFLEVGAAAGVGVALSGSGMGTLLSREAGALPQFTPYMVSLPVPPKAVKGALSGAYKITVDESTQAMHPKLPAVKVWGYNNGPKTSGYLGPTIEVDKNDPNPTKVEFTNNLPTTHLLPVDNNLPRPEGGTERGTRPRILTHLHGAFVDGENDGNPYATQDEYETGSVAGATQRVSYPSQPRATMLWYHDHAMAMTRLNVYAGLAGIFLVRDENDTGTEPNPIGIPGGRYEVPIVIQDKSFSGGQFFYSPDDNWIPEFFGDTPVINGAVQPFLTVEPRMYRLRFLNGSQSRFYNLKLDDVPFYQIGSEGGMFDKPVRMKSIVLLPAERADVIVDFRGLSGKNIELKNRSLPKGVVSPATPRISSLMQFRVRGTANRPGPTSIPTALPGSKPSLPDSDVVKTRYITLEEVLDDDGNPVRLAIDGRYFDDGTDEDDDGVDERPLEGTVEDWLFINISADTHPIHMHLTNFQVMGRTPLDGTRYARDLDRARKGLAGAPTLLPNNTIHPTDYLLGPEVAPEPKEKGWKDTVGANPNQVTRIRQRFDLPADASVPQKYVYHCHILEHEDNDMMRPFEVV